MAPKAALKKLQSLNADLDAARRAGHQAIIEISKLNGKRSASTAIKDVGVGLNLTTLLRRIRHRNVGESAVKKFSSLS
jgi:hypothetical protein